MKKLKRKLSIVLVLTFMLTMVLGAPAIAASWTSVKKVDAYSGVKIFYNGEQLADSTQPFIINDTTYVPLRLIMETLGNAIYWDAENYRVMMTGTTSSQLAAKDVEIAALKAQITKLEKELAELEGGSLGSIEDILSDYFEDAGYDYFDDSRIDVIFTLDGDEDDIAYTINLDFGSARYYDDLSDLDENDIEDFLDDVESEINKNIKGTNFKNADLTGKLVDYDNSKLYVKFNGRSYTYNWSSSGSLGEIEDILNDEFEGEGKYYFGDKKLGISISLTGNKSLINCYIDIDGDLTDYTKSKIKDFIYDVEEVIEDEIGGTSFKSAEVNITLEDEEDNKVVYNGSTFKYNW